jgi:hypothetical protein
LEVWRISRVAEGRYCRESLLASPLVSPVARERQRESGSETISQKSHRGAPLVSQLVSQGGRCGLSPGSHVSQRGHSSESIRYPPEHRAYSQEESREERGAGTHTLSIWEHGTPVYLGRRSWRKEASREACCTSKRVLLQEGCQGWGNAVRE